MDAMLQLGLMSDAPDSRIASANLTWVGPSLYCVTALSCPSPIHEALPHYTALPS